MCDFNDLFGIVNMMVKENKNFLKFNSPISVSYFKTLTRFLLHHKYIIFNDTIYKQSAD